MPASISSRNDPPERLLLVSTGREQDISGRELAEIYDLRWPIQEMAFRDWATAVKLDQHRDNGGRRMANVAVVTELKRIDARICRRQEELDHLRAQADAQQQQAAQVAERQHLRAARVLTVRRDRLDRHVQQGRTSGKLFTNQCICMISFGYTSAR